jgi:hypothetical protein
LISVKLEAEKCNDISIQLAINGGPDLICMPSGFIDITTWLISVMS